MNAQRGPTPTQPGWYWFRWHRDDRWTLAFVQPFVDGYLEFARISDLYDWLRVDDVSERVEWSERLEPPAENVSTRD